MSIASFEPRSQSSHSQSIGLTIGLLKYVQHESRVILFETKISTAQRRLFSPGRPNWIMIIYIYSTYIIANVCIRI
jgi:hypothetical protein